jgi:prophage antirepressor-like protein
MTYTSVALFQSQAIRKARHNGERYFSLIDVVAVLTESKNPTDYLKKLRKRDAEL